MVVAVEKAEPEICYEAGRKIGLSIHRGDNLEMWKVKTGVNRKMKYRKV